MTDPREALVALLNHPDHAPMSTHDPRDGSCQSCPWPLHEMPPEDIADAILAEFDVTPRGEGQWWESLVEAPCDQGHRVFIDDGDGGVYACPACALPPTVKPSLEQVVDALAAQRPGSAEWTSSRIMQTARTILALLPGRTETEVKAEALREAAPGCNCEDDYARLNDRADRIEKEADRG